MKIWQKLTMRWQRLIFGDLVLSPHVRILRLVEETFELAQAENVPEEQLLQVLRQVYDKKIGQPEQELGGVLICLAIYAETKGYDLEERFWAEFERIMDPAIMDRVRSRNLGGDKIGLIAQP